MNIYACFLIWLITCCESSSSLNLTTTNIDAVIQVIYQNVEFINDRLDQIIVDVILTQAFAEAYLTASLSSRNAIYLSEHQVKMLQDIAKMCAHTRISAINNFLTDDQEYNKLVTSLNQSDIWMHPIKWRYGLSKSFNAINPIHSLKHADSIMFDGIPQESESDYCLGELIKDDCRIPEFCVDLLLKEDGTRGYPLTHRLLILQFARAFGCKGHSKVYISTLTNKYCLYILQDLQDFEAAGFPLVSHDLAMEQMILCGMEGYLEFFSEHYLNLIISWKTPFGCFPRYRQQVPYRLKRSVSLMDYGCESHTTGLGIAALSLFIRVFIENHLNSTYLYDKDQ